MKQKLLFIFLFISITASICRAKDSTLVFKAGAGINYNRLLITENYVHSYYSHGGSGSESLKNEDTSSFNPVLKIGAQKLFNKNTGIHLQFSYYQSKLNYSTKFSNVVYPMTGSGSSSSTDIHYTIVSHNFAGSLGCIFYVKQFYLVPKANLSYMYYISKTDSIGTYTPYGGTTTTSRHSAQKNDAKFSGGFGLIFGYDVRIRKIILFFELQADYYDQPKNFYSRNGFNSSFTAGIGL